MRGLRWNAIDALVRAKPDEYCDVPPPGEAMSDRTFMRVQAERIVRSPKLTRKQREMIEQRWLVAEIPDNVMELRRAI